MEVAYRIYPLPNGTIYTENDIKTIDDVILLFDYCQILEACISKQGWQYLIQKFGIENLYQANNESGWLYDECIEEFIEDIKYYQENAYENEQSHQDITEFYEATHWPCD